tara:strand:- start:64 stop:267 length:204 start_codon:yes stop_codon:yes gene_type:complete
MSNIQGRTIETVRPMTPDEQDVEGWSRPAIVIVLDDGTKIYPSRDQEGNGPGAIFGVSAAGETFGLA